MRKSFRLALFVGVFIVAVSIAGSSLAMYKAPRTARPTSVRGFLAYSPSLIIEQSNYKPGAPFTADVFIAGTPSDDPTAKLTIISPAGYGVNLGQTPGTRIGTAAAVALIAGVPIRIPNGNVVVANPADPQVTAVSTQCTGSPTNQSVLALNLTLQQQKLTFLVFVNKVGAVATFQVCVPHPDNAPLGARPILIDATLKGIFTNPSTANGYEWAGDFTPYDPTTKLPNPAATVESRTWVGIPTKLTLKRVSAKRGFKLTGQLAVRGISPKDIKLDLWGGKKPNPAPTATTAGTAKKRIGRSPALPLSGKYTIARPNVRFTTYFQTRFENFITMCEGPSPSGLPIPCLKDERIAAVTSNQVKVLKPKPKKHR